MVLEREIQEFLVNREAQRLSPNTIEWYGYTLRPFCASMVASGVSEAAQVTSRHAFRSGMDLITL